MGEPSFLRIRMSASALRPPSVVQKRTFCSTMCQGPAPRGFRTLRPKSLSSPALTKPFQRSTVFSRFPALTPILEAASARLAEVAMTGRPSLTIEAHLSRSASDETRRSSRDLATYSLQAGSSMTMYMIEPFWALVTSVSSPRPASSLTMRSPSELT